MIFKLESWDKSSFSSLREYLFTISNKEYLSFNSSLTPGESKFIGVTIPKQKEIAKEIFKGNYISFLNIDALYHEEKMIKGFVISYIKDYDLFIKYMRPFLKEINNWAVCDCVMQSSKIFKKEQIRGWDFVLECLSSNQEYIIRVGIVLMLSYYINDNYIANVLKSTAEVKFEAYYVKMAVAWLFSVAFIKYSDLVIPYLGGRLDKFTNNKSISKIRDSYRVPKELKDYITKFRIK